MRSSIFPRCVTFVFLAAPLAACQSVRWWNPTETFVWHRAPPMLAARAAHAVVSEGNSIYALAGTGTGFRPVLTVERFDGEHWANETTLPEGGLNAPAAATIGTTIYLIGGFGTTSDVPTAAVWTYNTVNKRWHSAAPLPAPRGGHAAVVLDGKIHVVGGGNSTSTIADHNIFDPVAATWQTLAPLPRALGSPALVVHRGILHAIGGRSGFDDYGDTYLYDAVANVWRTGAAIAARGTAGAVVACDAILLFGGESQPMKKVLGEVFRLDPTISEWRQVSTLPTPRNFARTVVLGSSVYVVGGNTSVESSHASQGRAIVDRLSLDCTN